VRGIAQGQRHWQLTLAAQLAGVASGAQVVWNRMFERGMQHAPLLPSGLVQSGVALHTHVCRLPVKLVHVARVVCATQYARLIMVPMRAIQQLGTPITLRRSTRDHFTQNTVNASPPSSLSEALHFAT